MFMTGIFHDRDETYFQALSDLVVLGPGDLWFGQRNMGFRTVDFGPVFVPGRLKETVPWICST